MPSADFLFRLNHNTVGNRTHESPAEMWKYLHITSYMWRETTNQTYWSYRRPVKWYGDCLFVCPSSQQIWDWTIKSYRFNLYGTALLLNIECQY